jgi:hypothetical protein
MIAGGIAQPCSSRPQAPIQSSVRPAKGLTGRDWRDEALSPGSDAATVSMCPRALDNMGRGDIAGIVLPAGGVTQADFTAHRPLAPSARRV